MSKKEKITDNFDDIDIEEEGLTPEQQYAQMSSFAPTKDIDMPVPVQKPVEIDEEEDNESKPLSFSEALDNTSDLTDMQYAAAKLFPSHLGSKVANSVMIARVSPEVFLPMLRLMAVDEIMQSDPARPINVNSVYVKNYALLSIGLDGKGRIDMAELVGASRDQHMLEGGGGLP
jgi:hypothetical protein